MLQNDAMTSRAHPPTIAILIAMTALGPLALNIFVPSMPGLVTYFQTDYATVQLTLTLYLIGVAVAQLFYGPLSDRFGRRPLVLAGTALFAGASLLCIFAHSIEMLICGRVLQAVGGCSGMVLSRAIVRDVYERNRSASVLAHITMAMAVAPAIAPALGGVLEHWSGWRASFLLLTAVGGATMVCLVLRLRETNHDPQPLPGIRGMLVGYRDLLRSRTFLGYSLATAFATAAFFAFLAGAPYVMVNLLGRTPSEYGILFVLVSLGYMAGNFLAVRLSARLGVIRMVGLGTGLSFCMTLVMAGLGLAGILTPLAIFLPMACIAIGSGMSMPNAIAAAVSVNPRAAGAASGLLGFLQMTIGAVATTAVGLLQNETQFPMIGVVLAGTSAGLCAFLVARTGERGTVSTAPLDTDAPSAVGSPPGGPPGGPLSGRSD